MKLTTAILLAASLASAATLGDSLKAGKAGLQSAGPITFGPEGILFVGDTKGAALSMAGRCKASGIGLLRSNPT